MTQRLVNVLLVDDDAMDVKAVRRTFDKQNIGNPITVARDGQEALDVLRGQNGKSALPRPYMVLLDLQMPRMNGFEFLEILRADPELRETRVFVLTTSSHDLDRLKAEELAAEGYILKGDPTAFSQLGDLVRRANGEPH